jgi:hypothetical protein
MILFCDCGKMLDLFEAGVNGSMFTECKCGRIYNIYSNDIRNDGDDN